MTNEQNAADSLANVALYKQKFKSVWPLTFYVCVWVFEGVGDIYIFYTVPLLFSFYFHY